MAHRNIIFFWDARTEGKTWRSWHILDIFHFVMILTLSRKKSFPFQAVYDLFFLISTNTVYTMAALLTSQQVLCCREIVYWVPKIDLHTQTMSQVLIVKVESWIELRPNFSIFLSCTSSPPWFRSSTYFWLAGNHLILFHFDSRFSLGSPFFFPINAIVGRVEFMGPT